MGPPGVWLTWGSPGRCRECWSWSRGAMSRAIWGPGAFGSQRCPPSCVGVLAGVGHIAVPGRSHLCSRQEERWGKGQEGYAS